MTTPHYAIPAAVLVDLGGMLPGDPPVMLYCDGEIDLYHPANPRCVNDLPDLPDALLVLPQSGPTLDVALDRLGLLDVPDEAPRATLYEMHESLIWNDWNIGDLRDICRIAESIAGHPAGTYAPREETP